MDTNKTENASIVLEDTTLDRDNSTSADKSSALSETELAAIKNMSLFLPDLTVYRM